MSESEPLDLAATQSTLRNALMQAWYGSSSWAGDAAVNGAGRALDALVAEVVGLREERDTARECSEGACKVDAGEVHVATPGPRPRLYLLWKFIHNAVIHPLLSLPWEPKWAQRAHDWTALRCWGAG